MEPQFTPETFDFEGYLTQVEGVALPEGGLSDGQKTQIFQKVITDAYSENLKNNGRRDNQRVKLFEKQKIIEQFGEPARQVFGTPPPVEDPDRFLTLDSIIERNQDANKDGFLNDVKIETLAKKQAELLTDDVGFFEFPQYRERDGLSRDEIVKGLQQRIINNITGGEDGDSEFTKDSTFGSILSTLEENRASEEQASADAEAEEIRRRKNPTLLESASDFVSDLVTPDPPTALEDDIANTDNDQINSAAGIDQQVEQTARTDELRQSFIRDEGPEVPVNPFAPGTKILEEAPTPEEATETEPLVTADSVGPTAEVEDNFFKNVRTNLINSLPFGNDLVDAVTTPGTFDGFGTSTVAGVKQSTTSFDLLANNTQIAQAERVLEETRKQESSPLNDKIIEEREQEIQRLKGELPEVLTKYADLEKIIQDNTPKDLTTTQKGFRSGAQSLVRNTPGLLASAVLRTPSIAITSASVQTLADSYGAAIKDGMSHADATTYAIFDMGIEAGTEIIPAKMFVDLFKATNADDVAAMVGRFIVSDLAGEQVATLAQSMNAYGAGLDKELENAETFKEKAWIQVERQKVTAIASLFSSSVQGVGGGAVRVASGNIKPNKPTKPSEQKQFEDQLAADFKNTIQRVQGLDGEQLQNNTVSVQGGDGFVVDPIGNFEQNEIVVGGLDTIPVLQPDPSFSDDVSVPDVVGQIVTHQGETGILTQKQDGTFVVVTANEDIIVESGESGLPANQIDLKPAELNVDYDISQPTFDIDASEFSIGENTYTYESTNTNEAGETISINAKTANGENRTFRNPDDVAAIESAKIAQELDNAYEQSEIQKFIAEAVGIVRSEQDTTANEPNTATTSESSQTVTEEIIENTTESVKSVEDIADRVSNINPEEIAEDVRVYQETGNAVTLRKKYGNDLTVQIRNTIDEGGSVVDNFDDLVIAAQSLSDQRQARKAAALTPEALAEEDAKRSKLDRELKTESDEVNKKFYESAKNKFDQLEDGDVITTEGDDTGFTVRKLPDGTIRVIGGAGVPLGSVTPDGTITTGLRSIAIGLADGSYVTRKQKLTPVERIGVGKDNDPYKTKSAATRRAKKLSVDGKEFETVEVDGGYLIEEVSDLVEPAPVETVTETEVVEETTSEPVQSPTPVAAEDQVDIPSIEAIQDNIDRGNFFLAKNNIEEIIKNADEATIQQLRESINVDPLVLRNQPAAQLVVDTLNKSKEDVTPKIKSGDLIDLEGNSVSVDTVTYDDKGNVNTLTIKTGDENLQELDSSIPEDQDVITGLLKDNGLLPLTGRKDSISEGVSPAGVANPETVKSVSQSAGVKSIKAVDFIVEKEQTPRTIALKKNNVGNTVFDIKSEDPDGFIPLGKTPTKIEYYRDGIIYTQKIARNKNGDATVKTSIQDIDNIRRTPVKESQEIAQSGEGNTQFVELQPITRGVQIVLNPNGTTLIDTASANELADQLGADDVQLSSDSLVISRAGSTLRLVGSSNGGVQIIEDGDTVGGEITGNPSVLVKHQDSKNNFSITTQQLENENFKVDSIENSDGVTTIALSRGSERVKLVRGKTGTIKIQKGLKKRTVTTTEKLLDVLEDKPDSTNVDTGDEQVQQLDASEAYMNPDRVLKDAELNKGKAVIESENGFKVIISPDENQETLESLVDNFLVSTGDTLHEIDVTDDLPSDRSWTLDDLNEALEGVPSHLRRLVHPVSDEGGLLNSEGLRSNGYIQLQTKDGPKIVVDARSSHRSLNQVLSTIAHEFNHFSLSSWKVPGLNKILDTAYDILKNDFMSEIPQYVPKENFDIDNPTQQQKDLLVDEYLAKLNTSLIDIPEQNKFGSLSPARVKQLKEEVTGKLNNVIIDLTKDVKGDPEAAKNFLENVIRMQTGFLNSNHVRLDYTDGENSIVVTSTVKGRESHKFSPFKESEETIETRELTNRADAGDIKAKIKVFLNDHFRGLFGRQRGGSELNRLVSGNLNIYANRFNNFSKKLNKDKRRVDAALRSKIEGSETETDAVIEELARLNSMKINETVGDVNEEVIAKKPDFSLNNTDSYVNRLLKVGVKPSSKAFESAENIDLFFTGLRRKMNDNIGRIRMGLRQQEALLVGAVEALPDDMVGTAKEELKKSRSKMRNFVKVFQTDHTHRQYKAFQKGGAKEWRLIKGSFGVARNDPKALENQAKKAQEKINKVKKDREAGKITEIKAREIISGEGRVLKTLLKKELLVIWSRRVVYGELGIDKLQKQITDAKTRIAKANDQLSAGKITDAEAVDIVTKQNEIIQTAVKKGKPVKHLEQLTKERAKKEASKILNTIEHENNRGLADSMRNVASLKSRSLDPEIGLDRLMMRILEPVTDKTELALGTLEQQEKIIHIMENRVDVLNNMIRSGSALPIGSITPDGWIGTRRLGEGEDGTAFQGFEVMEQTADAIEDIYSLHKADSDNKSIKYAEMAVSLFKRNNTIYSTDAQANQALGNISQLVYTGHIFAIAQYLPKRNAEGELVRGPALEATVELFKERMTYSRKESDGVNDVVKFLNKYGITQSSLANVDANSSSRDLVVHVTNSVFDLLESKKIVSSNVNETTSGIVESTLSALTELYQFNDEHLKILPAIINRQLMVLKYQEKIDRNNFPEGDKGDEAYRNEVLKFAEPEAAQLTASENIVFSDAPVWLRKFIRAKLNPLPPTFLSHHLFFTKMTSQLLANEAKQVAEWISLPNKSSEYAKALLRRNLGRGVGMGTYLTNTGLVASTGVIGLYYVLQAGLESIASLMDEDESEEFRKNLFDLQGAATITSINPLFGNFIPLPGSLQEDGSFLAKNTTRDNVSGTLIPAQSRTNNPLDIATQAGKNLIGNYIGLSTRNNIVLKTLNLLSDTPMDVYGNPISDDKALAELYKTYNPTPKFLLQGYDKTKAGFALLTEGGYSPDTDSFDWATLAKTANLRLKRVDPKKELSSLGYQISRDIRDKKQIKDVLSMAKQGDTMSVAAVKEAVDLLNRRDKHLFEKYEFHISGFLRFRNSLPKNIKNKFSNDKARDYMLKNPINGKKTNAGLSNLKNLFKGKNIFAEKTKKNIQNEIDTLKETARLSKADARRRRLSLSTAKNLQSILRQLR